MISSLDCLLMSQPIVCPVLSSFSYILSLDAFISEETLVRLIPFAEHRLVTFFFFIVSFVIHSFSFFFHSLAIEDLKKSLSFRLNIKQ